METFFACHEEFLLVFDLVDHFLLGIELFTDGLLLVFDFLLVFVVVIEISFETLPKSWDMVIVGDSIGLLGDLCFELEVPFALLFEFGTFASLHSLGVQSKVCPCPIQTIIFAIFCKFLLELVIIDLKLWLCLCSIQLLTLPKLWFLLLS